MQYEPELFPGLIYRMKQPKIVLLIFVSGKIVITGAKVNPKISRSSSVICILMEFGCWYFCLFGILGERWDIHSLWKYIPCPYRVQESPAMVCLSIYVPCFISYHLTLIMLNLYVFSIGLQIHIWNGALVLLWIVMDDVGPSVHKWSCDTAFMAPGPSLYSNVFGLLPTESGCVLGESAFVMCN